MFENEEMYNDLISYSNKIVDLEEDIQKLFKENVNMKVELYDVRDNMVRRKEDYDVLLKKINDYKNMLELL